jgi:hypothetical protein
MWFEAMSPSPRSGWFFNLLASLLQGNEETLRLLRSNPFPDAPPRYVRAQYYRYRFTTPEEHRQGGRWWDRELIGTYYGPVSRAPKSR